MLLLYLDHSFQTQQVVFKFLLCFQIVEIPKRGVWLLKQVFVFANSIKLATVLYLVDFTAKTWTYLIYIAKENH